MDQKIEGCKGVHGHGASKMNQLESTKPIFIRENPESRKGPWLLLYCVVL